MKNKFCDSSLLSTEASVESLFIEPLLSALGYEAKDISYKEAISTITVNTGRKKNFYRPDFVLKIAGIPTVVVDAKAPTENIHDWEKQCSSYCLELNKSYEYNPVQLYCISNGVRTAIYKWDTSKPLVECDFSDFVDGNVNYEEFRTYLSKECVLTLANHLREQTNNEPFTYESIDLPRLSDLFQKLHMLIWKSEQKSPSAAFTELMKIVFVKISKDRDIHEKYGSTPKPKYSDVVFSKYWIQNETETSDPVNDLLFKNLVDGLEEKVRQGSKKRIFDTNERINLNPETIKKVVQELEQSWFGMLHQNIRRRLHLPADYQIRQPS